MNEKTEKIRVLSLFSGGLDSQLTVYVLREQGVHVEGIAFESPFFNCDKARNAAGIIGVPLHVVDFTDEIVRLLHNNRYGFGSGMNPCIDCRMAMLKRAAMIMRERRFHFFSTGEVLNQRPMTQNRQSLKIEADESGYGEFLVRPLSARLLLETEPEKRGWIDRSKLLAIEGRNRKAQYKLARHFGLTDIPQPAGGCKLTEPNFCKRLKDLMEHEGLDVRAVRLLHLGRHFRLDGKTKVIVGRNQLENDLLEKMAEPSDILVRPETLPGPSCLVAKGGDEEQLRIAAAICARYCDLENEEPVMIRVRSVSWERTFCANPEKRTEIDRMRI